MKLFAGPKFLGNGQKPRKLQNQIPAKLTPLTNIRDLHVK